MAQSPLIFVSGGVRSGKSSFAEKLAISHSTNIGGRLIYIACGKSGDPEMKERIARHKSDRETGFHKWSTFEYPVSIENAVPHIDPKSVVLLDCLTTLLNNEMFPARGGFDEWKSDDFLVSVKRAIMSGIQKIREQAACFIIVSNEVLHEPIIDQGVPRAYAKMIGGLHQEIVSKSDQAYSIEAGCAWLMKGELT
ncbi:bifunctional adenosylcobinamide kinase/adenosylcobinamide-phosphate guanylyltransferase [Bacillus sp. V5-8f]|uniref:bifunctional adenosylcobinamide kinase/adenosylcobinamide-phosphate guanylyltransferase n=1 Tax=Bacillus sp. V5-8f TaxID=2053044 RepID=UPI00215518EF|nr:bifunctional adenosylcobinamide kinase/adenosylcobinamide-phosphate guanylyltransferase [Bacillus sp. V5-8f]